MSFRTPLDVANRGLGHLGADRISETLGFTENSKRAATMAFLFDKLRRAELRTNFWKFSTRRTVLRAVDDATMIIAPALWDSTVSYRPGAIVTDEGNTIWMSNFPDNLNNTPGNSFFWDVYTGPLTCQPWDATTAYFSGELVYTFPGDGTFKVFVSLVNANSDNPATGTAYDATATYMKDQVVTYSATPFISLIDLNKANTPSATPAAWVSGTTYAATNQVYGSDGLIYTSVGSGNTGHDPTTDGGVHWTNTGTLKPWTSTFSGGTGSAKWLQIAPVTLTDFWMIYPVGSGPSSQSDTRNIFMLPAAFLRDAPQDPKAGATSYLGAPSGLAYSDWTFEGPFIVTRDVGPILLRFIADIQDVTAMDDLFCEGLAARMGLEGCEEITQSTAKRQACASEYEKWMGLAKKTNSIEIGAIEPPEDDFLTCRA